MYDDIPVYASGRVHFGFTRELWKLQNLAVWLPSPYPCFLSNKFFQIVDPERRIKYGIRKPYTVSRKELRPFLKRCDYLRVIGMSPTGLSQTVTLFIRFN